MTTRRAVLCVSTLVLGTACAVPSAEPGAHGSSPAPGPADATPPTARRPLPGPSPEALCQTVVDLAIAELTEPEPDFDEDVAKFLRECVEEQTPVRTAHPGSYALRADCAAKAKTEFEAHECLELEDPTDPRVQAREAPALLREWITSVHANFQQEFVERGPGNRSLPPHRCPHDGNPTGSVGPTPPLSVPCAGPNGTCSPVASPRHPFEYDQTVWTTGVWAQLHLHPYEPHHFRYAYRWANATSGYGSCQFTVQAFGDLDGDGVYSTYSRSAKLDEHGIEVKDLAVLNPLE